MPSDILQLFISGFFSLAGAGVGVLATSKLTNYRLEQLEKKVDKLSENDQRIALLEQRMSQYEKEKK
jgi:hypothetical protein